MSDRNFTIEVAGETIDLAAVGLTQIQRLSKLTRFLKSYGKQAIRETDFSTLQDGNSISLVGLLIDFIGSLDDEGLILLGEMVSGRDSEFVTEHFDLEWIVDGLTILLQTPAFRKIVDSFFGGQG